MQRIIVQVPMTKDLKDRAEIVSSDLGFSSLQETIRVLLTKLSKREFNFKVEENEKPSQLLISAMKKAKENRKKGKSSPVFDNIEDELSWLKKQGI